MQQQITKQERGERIGACLKDLGVRQIDIADELDIRRTVVSGVIHGRDMSARVVEKLREVGVPEELLEGLGRRQKPKPASVALHSLSAVGKISAASAR